MDTPSDTYLKALEAAKQELVEVTAVQERLEKRKIALRKAIEVFSGLTESDGENNFSADAVYLIENKALPDEIRGVLKSLYPSWVTPNRIMSELKQMGRDLTKYTNPQSAIQTVLKRMTESSDDPTEESTQDGKKAYRCAPLSHQLAEAYGISTAGVATLGKELQEMISQQNSAAQLAVESVQAAFKEQQERIAEACKSIGFVEAADTLRFTPPTEISVLNKQINDAVTQVISRKKK